MVRLQKKIDWQYYFARKYSLQRYQIVLGVTISDFWQKHFNVRTKNILVKPGGGANHEIWMDNNEWPKAQKQVFNIVYQNLKSWRYYKRIFNQTNKQFVAGAKKIIKQVNTRLSNAQLAKLHRDFINLHQNHFNKPIYIPFATEPFISGAAQEALANTLKRAKVEKEYNKWFEVIFSSQQKNAITRQRQAVLGLFSQIEKERLNQTKIKKQIKLITKKFCWIPCYDVVDEPWDITHFTKELAELFKGKKKVAFQELDDLRRQFKKHKVEFRNFLKAFKMTKREREIFIMAHDFVFIKDERDDHRREGCGAIRPLFAEIGKRLGLSIKEVCHLSIEETQQFLRKGNGPSLKEIRERVSGYLLLRKYGQPLVIASGKKMKQILAKELPVAKMGQTKEVKGLIGYSGKVIGKVVIVRTKHDLRRVFAGSVMVAVTTNPDYVPVMRQCKAIVTDEGGITCHAAIVSRELKIPCIVGTKVATQVFQDGDEVEVDANKGIVKKI